MDKSESSYRQIFKSTSLFGSVQLISILLGIIRNKVIAVLLGTTGVGTIGLFNSVIAFISSLTSLGLNYSVVREISEANESNDDVHIAIVTKTFRRWVVFTGLLGTIFTIALSSWLSYITFNNSDYTWAFIWLSSILFFNAIGNGQRALLQGLRRLSDMAKATILGASLSLLVSLPFYYIWGIDGIVPSLVASAVITLLSSWWFSRKIELRKVAIGVKDCFDKGKSMAKLGIAMVFSSIVSSGFAYVLNSYIGYLGGIEQVGLYTAGWGIIVQYTNLVFGAMSTDYFPRLSAINKDNTKVNELVNQQAEVAILIIGPIMILLLATIPLVIKLFYTSAFLSVVDFANWTVFGTLLRAPSHTLAYILLAKGNSKLYLKVEVTLFIIFLITNMAGYSLMGLEGLGISFVVNYTCYLMVYIYITKMKYNFHIDKKLYKIFAIIFLLVLISFITSKIASTNTMYFIGGLLFILSSLYSLKELDKRINIKSLLYKYKK